MISSDKIFKAIRNSAGFTSVWQESSVGGDARAAIITKDILILLQDSGVDILISGSNGVIQKGFTGKDGE